MRQRGINWKLCRVATMPGEFGKNGCWHPIQKTSYLSLTDFYFLKVRMKLFLFSINVPFHATVQITITAIKVYCKIIISYCLQALSLLHDFFRGIIRGSRLLVDCFFFAMMMTLAVTVI